MRSDEVPADQDFLNPGCPEGRISLRQDFLN
jgi:hypothetical protein